MNWTGFEFYQNIDFINIYCKHRKLLPFYQNENNGLLFKKSLIGNLKLRVYTNEDITTNSIKNIIEFCKVKHIPVLEIISSCSSLEIESNYTHNNLGTYVLNLHQDLSTIWTNFKKQNRNEIRYAEKMGVVIDQSENLDDFETWWSIYEETAKRGGFILQKYSLVRELFERKDLSRLFIARVDNKIVSGAFLLINKWPFWWIGGSLSNYWKFKPNNLLHWKIIEWAQEKKYPFYDMGGASKDANYGPNNFKKQFGGEYKECCKYTIILNNFQSGLINKLIKLRYKVIKKH